MVLNISGSIFVFSASVIALTDFLYSYEQIEADHLVDVVVSYDGVKHCVEVVE